MKFIQSILFSIILCSACSNSDKKIKSTNNTASTHFKDNSNNEWIFDKITGSKLKFKNGKEFNTNLYDLNYIGQVVNEGKAPFLIFSGRECNECDESISVYVRSPVDGDMQADGKNQYQYPGVQKDIESDTVLYRGRAFFGEVLPGINGVIWYQRYLQNDQTWFASALLVKFGRGITTDILERDTSKIEQTLRLLKTGKCQEIKGITYTSEP